MIRLTRSTVMRWITDQHSTAGRAPSRIESQGPSARPVRCSAGLSRLVVIKKPVFDDPLRQRLVASMKSGLAVVVPIADASSRIDEKVVSVVLAEREYVARHTDLTRILHRLAQIEVRHHIGKDEGWFENARNNVARFKLKASVVRMERHTDVTFRRVDFRRGRK